MSRQGPLREGFTTGTAAAGAAKAAAVLLLTGHALSCVETPLPGGKRLTLAVADIAFDHDQAVAAIVKDGGDDPDVTHGTDVVTTVTLTDDGGL